MLLTSWVESMRVAFEKSRKATLNPRRRLQLRSVPSAARQKVQRRIAIEQLEDRTLLTSLIINQLTPGLGVTLNNSNIDADSDGISDYDTILFEGLTIDASTGAGVSIDLDGLTFEDEFGNPASFQILFDNVTINSSGGVGVDIELSNLEVGTIAVDSSTISGAVGNAFNVDLTNVTLNEFNVIDSTLAGSSGAGLTLGLSTDPNVDPPIVPMVVGETSIRRSTIDGVAIDVSGGARLEHTTIADSQISGSTGNDGVSLNVVDSVAEELRLTNNNGIQGVSLNIDDTTSGEAALLTELFIQDNTISGNLAGDGVDITLNNVDLFATITGNYITGNSGNGITFDQTDGDLTGALNDNYIANNTGHGIYFTPSTTDPVPTAAAPGVPEEPGIPGGPTHQMDFSGVRNEVQLITFAGVADGGTFRLQYTDNRGNVYTTGDIDHTATALQVKAALVALNSDIGFDDVLVNGNFVDGYEVEFINDLGGINVNSLEVVANNLSFATPGTGITQSTAFNQSETQIIQFDNIPSFGTYSLFFLGQSTTFNYNATDNEIETRLETLAANAGYIGADLDVTAIISGFEVEVVDDLFNPLAYINIDTIISNADGLNFYMTVSEQQAGTSSQNEEQLLEFNYLNNPTGEFFTLTFNGTPTGPIEIGPADTDTRDNIDAALEAEFGSSGDDFGVTGTLASGFVIEFRGDLEETNHPLLQAAMVNPVDITVIPSIEGFGQNEIQSIVFPAQPGGGDFTLTLGSETTDPLAYNATAADVQAALEALANIGAGNVSVTKVITGVNSFLFEVEFVGSNSLRPADYVANSSGSPLTIDASNLVAAVPTVKTVAEGTSLNEVQEIMVAGTPTGGDFILTYAGVPTGSIAYNATAADILAELNTIPVLNGNVLVRGNAETGFEIEYVGALAGVNAPLIEVESNLTGASMTAKTVYVGGALRGIRGNTISGNSGAGIEVDLAMYTSFYGDIVGNTISSNQTQGINLIAADPTTLKSVDFSLSVDSNAMDGNRGAAIAVNMQDTAAGDLSVTNNTITRTVNDNLASTPYTGDAIYVDLYGTDVSFEAFNQLRDLTIDGNFIGTDSTGSSGLGNVGHGIGIHIEESTIIDRTQISHNFIMNNSGDGVNFHREDDARVGAAAVDPIVGEERAVRIYSNTISGNSDGIDILAQNGSLTTTDFEIKDNVLSSNLRDGIKMHAEADALIFADIINNEINTNSMNGIESTSYSSNYFGTDKRDVAGTWIQNTISNNLHHGIDISGRIGNHEMLFIGLNGVDPVTGVDRGNLISGNGRDGIQVAALIDRVDGRVKIANNQILSNSTGGVELTGAGLQSSIDNNLIAYNTGKGIDINSNGQVSFIRGNTITENTFDGLEVLSANRISHGEDGRSWTLTIGPQITTSVTAVGNFIDNNGGRGVDLQTEDRANSDFMFGDGTEAGANRIVSNALEGFYVVTTASVGQDQDANSTTALDATGSVTNSDADMVLQVNTNYIQDNGVNSNFTTNGLILRIGTMNSIFGGGSYSTQALGSGAAVGNEDAGNSANGRSNVSVTGNVFEGNYGEDVFIESFVSTVDPNVTQDVWVAPSGNPAFRVLNSYQRDPLARLNLHFEENIGNGLDVTNFGAYYDTAEPEFKSRLNNYTAPVPDGPFNSATRRRNAQRIASRAGWRPTTEASPNGPPDVGDVNGASIDPVSGRILIQSDDVSALSNGYVVEITPGITASQNYFGSPIYGLFEIADVDYSSNTFTLLSTEGYDLTGYSTTGSWATTENTNSFVYDGVGTSTFRVSQGFGNNSFDSYASRFTSSVVLGNLTGEYNFAWDLWNPDENTFLTPFVQTFLTADISVAAPDPTNSNTVGPFIISFSEDVSLADVDVSDFTLLRNNIPVTTEFNTYAVLEQLDARTFRLNIDDVLDQLGDQNGEYELRLNSSGTGISDVKNDDLYYSYLDPFNSLFNVYLYNDSPLLFGDVERFTIDQERPTADIVDVPSIRSEALGEVVINFSEDVTGVDLSDFTLTREVDSVVVLDVNLSSTLATLTQVTGSQFILDLSKVTSLSGDYVLTLNPTDNSITDLAGNILNGQTDDVTHSPAKLEWTNDSLAPIPSFDPVGDLSNGDALGDIYLHFTEDVSGSDLSDLDKFELTLTQPNGVVVSIDLSTSSITQEMSNDPIPVPIPGSYVISLDSTKVAANGIYTLTFLGDQTDVVDVAGNKVAGTASETWQRGDDITPLTAGIENVDDQPITVGPLTDPVIVNFSDFVDITTVNVSDFKLWYDDGSGSGPVDVIATGSVSVTPKNVKDVGGTDVASLFELNLNSVTTPDGLYTLELPASGSIADLDGNTLLDGASETWRIGTTGPVATIQGLPDALATDTLLTDAGIVTIDFGGEDVNGVSIDDFRLTLNGQDVSLAGLVVTPSGSTASSFTLDLSTVTQLNGNYTLTLVAAGSGIVSASGGLQMLDNASESWAKTSMIDLTAGSFDDIADATVGDGVVGTNGVPASQTLRAAIQEANAAAGANVILLNAGTYNLDIAGGDEDLAATGDLDIRDNLTIRGQGVDVTFIAGDVINGFLDRIFQVFAGVTLTLEDLTITGGRLTGSDDGAGIRNSGTTTLKNVKVEGNISEDSAGGINNTGTMYIVDSTISGNTAASSGGGIRNTGTLQISGSTLNGNTAERDGGALFNAGAGVVTVTNTTWSDNTATRSGGAIRNTATLNATNNTMTLNTAGTSGGAVANSGTANLQNDLVLGNTAAIDSELSGDYNSLGGNLIGLVGSATGFGGNDILGVIDPSVVLDSNLADNGGPTQTHALLLGSIAIDAGINTNISSTEQRGSQRVLGAGVDIGAVEYGAIFVNSLEDTEDADPGDGIVADSSGNVTLRAAIQEANALGGDALIVLGAGSYDLSLVGADEDQAGTGDLDITNTTGTLTIVGAGSGQTTINAAGLGDDRVFDVLAGAELTLNGLKVTGGNIVGGSGGGIRNFGTVSLVNATVDGNTAEINGGGVLNGEPGQAGVLNVTSSVISGNNSVDGGGIYNDVQSVVTIVDSTLTGNNASEDGAGLYNDSPVAITISRSNISGNVATLNGGGIYNNHLGSLTIADSKVNGNDANEGGGIFNADSATLIVTGTTVSGNTTVLGGAGIYNDGGSATLDDVSILINHANQDGGGLYNATGGEVIVTDSYFDNNSADRDGGAIANFGTTLSITETTLRDSVADRFGGGLYNDQEEGSVSLLSSTIYNNQAKSGGGIYNQELGVITLDLSDVLQNSAVSDGNSGGDGGGIYNTANATLTVERTTVDGNQAVNGAGIYNDDVALLNLTNSTVSNNMASGDGGGLYNNAIVLANIVNATISGNAAAGQGGGIFNTSDGSLEIVNATIYNNEADQGGGIYNDLDGFVRLANTIVAGNSVSGSTSPDLFGDFVSRGYNLIGLIDTGVVTGFADDVNNDQVGTTLTAMISPGLGALQDNGGATFTHELLAGSLARDEGNNFYAPTNDQRGFARLFDGDGNGSLIVDIGAFESGYIVTSFGDSVDADPGDGVSVDANGRSTLRAAIIESNARAGADTILLGIGTYTLSLFGLGENNGYLGDLDITDDLTIIGAGSGKTFIDANYLDRIFQIFSGVNVSIRGVTLVNGDVTRVEDGGAILNFGNLTLEDVEIKDSLANRGGALFNNGDVTMTDSYFHNNTAIADGGAIFNNDSGTLSIDLSDIKYNDAENGGAIFNSAGGTLQVNDTTIDGNTATVAGGGVFVSNEASVGNGEGSGGVNIPASTNVVVGAGSDGDYNYQVYDSGYEEHSFPEYQYNGSEDALLSEAPPFPVGETFNLSSLPGASHTIYLDFDGHTTTGTQWNNTYGTIVTPAYDTDGDVSTFSLAEIEVIQRTWLRVAEDFAPFNVNVTTVEPPVSDLIRTDSSDSRWGVRVVIGENTWYNLAGGVAYVGSFTSNVDTPTYVFNTGLIGVSEAVSHEVGHTLGLVHDGTSTEEYYAGHGSGPTGWAPIMGVGYYEDLVQWSQGEYTDANNNEDDLSIITTQNGFGYRADDYGSTIGTAASISGGTTSGIIERNTDVDYFEFTTTGGDITIDPFFESPNLDILATLYDSSGTQISTSNPIGALNASFTGLGSGTYYVSIEGTGEGSVSGTGYSDYGSLGQYTITVTGQPPTVEAGSVSISNSTISNNSAGTRGGGLLNEDTLELSNVTISGNEAGKQGGGIHNTGELTVNNTTIYNNTTEGSGGGIFSTVSSSLVNIQNTIVAGNNALVSGVDLVGGFTSGGHNLIGSSESATGFVDGFNGDIVGSSLQRIDPFLSPLQNNGGPTWTHALLQGSRAIDAGDNTDGVGTDQRGADRPTDDTSDIGAFEVVTPTISISDVSQVEDNNGVDTRFQFVVTLSNPNVDDVSVNYYTTNGTATAGEDYDFTTGTVHFSAGETTQIIEVVVHGDTDPEAYETFFVNLFNASGAAISAVAGKGTGTIENDDAEITIYDAPQQKEGSDGTTTNFVFNVELTHPVAGEVTVYYSTVDGSAEAGSDYIPQISQPITFAEGVWQQTITVEVFADTEIEGNETFKVVLGSVDVSGTVNAVIDNGEGIGTIENDDQNFATISNATMVEPPNGSGPALMTFQIHLSHAVPTGAGSYTIDVTTMSDLSGLGIAGLPTELATATAGTDYGALSSLPVTFAEGEDTKTVTVAINGDASVEYPPEFFYVVIDTSDPITILDQDKYAIGTIVDASTGLVVTTPDDQLDLSDTMAGFDAGDLSLREAIQLINNGVGNYDTIILKDEVYHIGTGSANENGNASGDFDILEDMTIIGLGAGLTIIDADPVGSDLPYDRIFHTAAGVKFNLSNMELRNGTADDGGAIYSQGETTVDNVIFRDNTANFLGGAIVSLSTLNVSDAQFIDNHAGFQGGAIYQYSGTATVERTTFDGNTSDGRAGAIYVSMGDISYPAATLDVSQTLFYNNAAGSRGGAIYNESTVNSTNVTYSGNHSGTRGGAIFNAGTLTVIFNTLTENIADQTGGGISNDTGATATLVNTIVAGNTGTLGNNDLGGAYVTTDSKNNLVGDIGTATGLTVGNGNKMGDSTNELDPLLGALLDNGGPTKTHLLLVGSQAIDGGVTIAGVDVDQRGYVRPLTTGGTPDIGAVEAAVAGASLIGTGGDSGVVDEETNIQISVVKNRTTLASDGTTMALPGNLDWVDEWDSFWVEVWVDTASGFGISDVLTNIAYNTAYFSATSVEFSPNFNYNRSVIIDDEAGVVRNLGGSNNKSYVGGTGYALLARIKFESLATDQVDVDPTDLTLNPLQLGLDIQDTQISVAGVGEVEVNVGALPETDLYPVIYDINDDDVINYRDLTFFAAAYNQNVLNASSAYATALDFNKNGRVDYKDLTLLAANYNKRKGGSSDVVFPTNFGQKWIGTQLEVNSGDNTIDEVVAAAVDTWETALGLTEPLEVQIVVKDFGSSQLGSGQTTEYNVDGIPVAGRVVIDDDANGLGWNVDVTDAPTAGGYDLYTVLIHEIGHVLGFTPYFSGFSSLIETDGSGNKTFVGSDFTVKMDSLAQHIDDPAFSDDLMNDTLDPGVRKSISDLDVKMLLEAYAVVTGGSGSGSSNPIYGTNNVQTSEPAAPTLVQSTEAAQTFVAESTISLAAPAIITRSKEENADDSLSQTSTFDVIQPSLYEQDLLSDGLVLDGSLVEDLYSDDFEDGYLDVESDDRELVFAHSDEDLGDDYQLDQEAMDDAFTNWEGPLL